MCAELFQALNDVGFTIPAQAATYWVGEAMQAVDYQDLDDDAREDRGHDAAAGPQRHPPRRGCSRSSSYPCRVSGAAAVEVVEQVTRPVVDPRRP